MMKKSKRTLVILLIVFMAIGSGFLINRIWNALDPTPFIQQYAEEYDVPVSLVHSVIEVESHFNPYATSSVGARGLMQMMPATFEWLTGEEHLCEYLPSSLLYDSEVSIRYGVYYLRYLYDKFGSWDLVLAAYNGGEGNVAKWLQNPEYSDGKGNLTYIPFTETRNYVEKVKDAQKNYEQLHDREEKNT